MFESHRRYKTCILCGRNDITREHIFGKSFAEHLNISQAWSAVSTPKKVALAGRAVKGSSPITHVAPGVLCTTCNNVKLSGTMSSSLPHLIALSAGNQLEVSTSIRDSLRKYFERIALIIDVCTSTDQTTSKRHSSLEYQLTERNRQAPALLSDDERRNWLNGAALDSVAIYLGHHKGVLGLNPDVNVFHIRVKQSDGTIVDYGKRITFVIQQFAVCLDINMKGSPISKSFLPISSVAQWPSCPDVTYDDYFSLRHQDDAVRHLRMLFAMPSLVSEIEALSRVNGTLTFPFPIS